MTDKNILIYDIHELKEIKKQLEKVVNDIKSSIASIDSKITAKEKELLDYMLANKVDVDSEVSDLVAAVFRKENTGYKNENDVIAKLKEINRVDLIKVKITESLDKLAIKKALKTDTTLSEHLNSMVNNSTTEYVVVTTKDNYSKMIEHINDGSNNQT